MSPLPPLGSRLERMSLALGVGLLIGLLFYLVAGNREESSFVRGDFPAFYAAAELVWTGQGAVLYDFNLQREIENRYWPDFAGGYYIFAYPPFFALILSPLASLPPLFAKAMASGLLFAALFVALLLARQWSGFVRRHFLFSLLYLVSFAPLQISLVGVQNTALTILCFALIYGASRQGHALLVGLGSALLLYKPQFGAIFFLYLLSRANKDELIGWSLGALALYLLGTLVLGVSWPFVWLGAATQFGDANFTINDHNMISIAGVIYWAFAFIQGTGASGLPWAYGLSAGLLILSAGYLRREEHRFVLAPHLVLLLSPQTLFYDVALALFFLIQDLRPDNPRDFLMLAAIWIYGLVALLLRDLGFPLSSLLLVAILWIHVRRIKERKSVELGQLLSARAVKTR
jgi:hypothetical protein